MYFLIILKGLIKKTGLIFWKRLSINFKSIINYRLQATLNLKKIEQYLEIKQYKAQWAEERSLFVPFFMSIGILIYYNLDFEPNWNQLFFLMPGLFAMIIFKNNFIKSIGIILAFILLGLCAFKFKVEHVNYNPVEITSKEIIVKAKIDEIRLIEYDEEKDVKFKLLLSNLEFKNYSFQNSLPNSLPQTKKHERSFYQVQEHNKNEVNQIDYTVKLPKKALISAEKEFVKDLEVGKSAIVKVRLNSISMNSLPFQKDYRLFAFFENIGSGGKLIDKPIWISNQNDLDSENVFKRIKNKLKKNMQKAFASDANLLLALMLGEKNTLDKKTLNFFNDVGLGHVLSISGLHMSIVAFISFMFAKVLILLCSASVSILHSMFSNIVKLKPKINNFQINGLLTNKHSVKILDNMLLIAKSLSLFGIVCFLLLTGASFSAIRASFMFIIGLILFYTQRYTILKYVLSTTVFLILLIYPESLFYPSFQFSIIAMVGICVLYNKSYNAQSDQVISENTKHVNKNFISKLFLNIKKNVFSTIVITSISFPLMMHYFQNTSLQPFLANIICLPYIVGFIIPSFFIWLIITVFFSWLNYIPLLNYLYFFILFCIGKLINLELYVLKFLLNHMQDYAYIIDLPYISGSEVCIYGLCIWFLISRFKLLRIVGFCSAVFPLWFAAFYNQKPNLIIDQYGNLAFYKTQSYEGNVMFVSWNPNADNILEKNLCKYWNIKKVIRFNACMNDISIDQDLSKYKVFHLDNNQKTSNVLFELDNLYFLWWKTKCKTKKPLSDDKKILLQKNAKNLFCCITSCVTSNAFSCNSFSTDHSKYKKQKTESSDIKTQLELMQIKIKHYIYPWDLYSKGGLMLYKNKFVAYQEIKDRLWFKHNVLSAVK